jgi:DNA repair protein SbcC/Rad50
MKFLYVTDTHLTGKGPSSRTDNYVNAIFEKLEELKQVIVDENIEAVFHGGDLFDKPIVSLQLTGQVANFIKSTGIPWYVVPGNHDLFGYNIKSLPQTSLGLLSKAGVVSILDRQYGSAVFSNFYGETISFEGQEYHMDIDHRDPKQDYWVEGKSDVNILIPHSMLLDKEYFPDVSYTNTKDLKDATNADLILVGHNHDGYKRHSIHHASGDITHIFNPGSMTRDEGSKGNLTRRPQYVIIDFPNAQSWSYQAYEFQCAAEGKNIFDRSHITSKQTKDRYLQNFEKKLSDVKLDAVDVRDVLDKLIAKDTSIDKEIAEESRDRLVEAEQTMDDVAKQMTGYVEKANNIGISEIVIRGFQSHEDTAICLSTGFNAIIGASDSGKTSIIRAIRFALYNEPKGTDFIRQGSKQCEVIIRFSDGGEIKRLRTRSSAGVYEITDDKGNTTSLKGFSNNVPVDVPNIHQMPYIQLAKDMETSLNVGYQLEAPFLIGESPGKRAAIIGRLTGVNLVDTAVREIGKDILGNTRDIKSIANQISTTEDAIKQFDHLLSLKDRLDKANKTIASVELSQRLKEEYEDIEHHYSVAVSEESSIISELKQLESTKELALKVSQLELLLHEKKEYESLHILHQEVYKEEKETSNELKKTMNGLHHVAFLSELEQNVLNYKELKELQNEILLVTKEEDNIHKAIHALPSSLNLGDIEDKVKERNELQLLRQRLQENRLQINELRKEIRLSAVEESKAQEEYQRILEENGTCPTCHQTIKGKLHEHTTY